MKNLSKAKRERMLNFLADLKKDHNDDNAIRAFSEIENQLVEKKYGLVWEEHEENVDKKIKEYIPIFQEDKTRKIVSNQDSKFNFLIEGDNLQVLYLLEKTHKGCIDVIYIDPPYNTGSEDFIYDDNYVDVQDGFRHSKWLSFMHKRLSIAYNLLAPDGIIMISIDDNEYSQLKILCDEVFGFRNRLSTHHIQVRYSNKTLNEKNDWQPVMEYVLIYAKDANSFEANKPEEEYSIDKFIYQINELTKGTEFNVKGRKVTLFKNGEWEIIKHKDPDKKLLKETWVSGSIYTGTGNGPMVQNVIEPRIEQDGLNCLYKIDGLGEDGLGYRYFTGPKKAGATRCKMFSGVPIKKSNELENGGAVKYRPITNIYDFSADFGNIRHEGGVPFNSGKKPVKMLKQLINYHKKKDATVLDFFAGSGSTAEAVLTLNKEDGGNRKFIIATNNEVFTHDEALLLNNKGLIEPEPKKGTKAYEKWYEKLQVLKDSAEYRKLELSEEYDNLGICKSKTFPRVRTVITGIKPDGKKYSKEIPENLKYFKCEWIERKPENCFLSNVLCLHIKEMIELQNHIEIDNKKYVLILNKDDYREVFGSGSCDSSLEQIWVNQNIVFNSSEMETLKKYNFKYIPKQYFGKELREAAE